jgi:hypothetical protein
MLNGKTVLLKNGRSIECLYPIAQAIPFGELMVIRLEVPSEVICNENVLAFDAEGHECWKVPARTYVYENSPYVRIECEGDTIILYNWDGLNLVLDRNGHEIRRFDTR